jgi:hypothetical protein
LEVLETYDLSLDEQKACYRAMHDLMVRSELKAKVDKTRDQEIFNHFLEKLRKDKVDNMITTFSLMNDGYSSAMTHVATNHLGTRASLCATTSLFKGFTQERVDKQRQRAHFL